MTKFVQIWGPIIDRCTMNIIPYPTILVQCTRTVPITILWKFHWISSSRAKIMNHRLLKNHNLRKCKLSRDNRICHQQCRNRIDNSMTTKVFVMIVRYNQLTSNWLILFSYFSSYVGRFLHHTFFFISMCRCATIKKSHWWEILFSRQK